MEEMLRLPEAGMGFHLVDFKLKNGTILRKRVVVNSEFVLLEVGEEITPDDIEEILPSS